MAIHRARAQSIDIYRIFTDLLTNSLEFTDKKIFTKAFIELGPSWESGLSGIRPAILTTATVRIYVVFIKPRAFFFSQASPPPLSPLAC